MSGGIPRSLKDAFGSLVLCRKCNGRGSRTTKTKGADGKLTDVEKPCGTCGGDGVVPAPRGWGEGYPR